MSFPDPLQLAYGALLAAVIAIIAGVLRLLTFYGALAALLIGFLVFGFGGLPFAVPLLAFFFSSSLLSRVGAERKAAARARYDKGERRDAWQVLANGAVPAALAVVSALGLRAPTPRTAMLLFLAALAAVNGDTWATEIGGLARAKPWLVTSLRRVEPGTSGAISPLGIVAALLGAAFVVAAGRLAWPARSLRLFWPVDPAEMLAITWGGFVAVFADSILGASVQAQYRCAKCGGLTEGRRHCGQPAQRVRGVPWVTNDVVNFVTSLLGALFAWLLLVYVAYP